LLGFLQESKLSACRQSFKEHEALVYHQLTNLIRDTVWLKSYLSGEQVIGHCRRPSWLACLQRGCLDLTPLGWCKGGDMRRFEATAKTHPE
jgi:hypothetical protein